MSIKQSLLAQLACFIVAILYSMILSFHMPAIVPTHWDASGHVNAYGSKWMNLLIMPGVILFIMLLTVWLPKLSPEKFRIEPFEGTYSILMLIVSGLMLATHLIILQASKGGSWDFSKTMMCLLFLFIASMGNFMGKIQPNFYMGVRTPWTLSDERVWRGTHRYAGRLWVFGSLFGLAATLIGAPFYLVMTYFMVMCLLPVFESYRLYKSLH